MCKVYGNRYTYTERGRGREGRETNKYTRSHLTLHPYEEVGHLLFYHTTWHFFTLNNGIGKLYRNVVFFPIKHYVFF